MTSCVSSPVGSGGAVGGAPSSFICLFPLQLRSDTGEMHADPAYQWLRPGPSPTAQPETPSGGTSENEPLRFPVRSPAFPPGASYFRGPGCARGPDQFMENVL